MTFTRTHESDSLTRRILAAGATLLVLGALGACGDDSDGDPSSSDTTAPTATKTPDASVSPTPDTSTGVSIDVTIKGDDINPNGERLQAKVGEPITINVDSDRAGEIHVHSTPEQELEYGVGTTTLTLTIDTPGIVAVEDHHADVTIVSLEVS